MKAFLICKVSYTLTLCANFSLIFATYIGSRLQQVKGCKGIWSLIIATEIFNIAVNSFSVNIFDRCSQVLILTEFVLSGNLCECTIRIAERSHCIPWFTVWRNPNSRFFFTPLKLLLLKSLVVCMVWMFWMIYFVLDDLDDLEPELRTHAPISHATNSTMMFDSTRFYWRILYVSGSICVWFWVWTAEWQFSNKAFAKLPFIRFGKVSQTDKW